jgi:ectoine hydroxylase-related dioxygenase (phytanoyl-CoA dioxygenase family)
MIFDKHRGYQQLELTPERSRQNIYNTPLNVVTPAEKDVVLFSSGLQHYVEQNATNEPRHAIAFNTFVQGKFGNYRDVSELAIAPTKD